MKRKFKIILISIFISIFGFTSCDDYLDIVPDNVATLEYAFRMRSTALGYLATCYSFLPDLAYPSSSPVFMTDDSFWIGEYTYETHVMSAIARGLQNSNNPVIDYWDGRNSGKDYWTAISQCNIFLENIETVPDMEEWEIKQWIAEVKFLKAYYYFFLLRMYGPVPIFRENIPISAPGDEVRVNRDPVDDVFAYIVELIDEAEVDLPDRVADEQTELGRITRPIALSLKAKALVYAASPLFNGNKDYADFTNKDDPTPLFSNEYSVEKWEKAAIACKAAIDLVHSIGGKLYEFEGSYYSTDLSEVNRIRMNSRAVTERWNPEIIWANTDSPTRNMQRRVTPQAFEEKQRQFSGALSNWGVTLNLAKYFYSKNGVPIEEDITWHYNDRFKLREATEADRLSIRPGEITSAFNFDREHRFYGSLGFDRGVWYGNGKYEEDDLYWLKMRQGEFMGKYQTGYHPVTGYFAKKLVYYTNTHTNSSTYSSTNYPWVMIRLADLYLMYAEALNEADGPSPEVYEYLNLIRARAGLDGVEESWSNFSRNPTKHTTKEGLREIIRQERTIELAFEGHRVWDIRRWKTAPLELNGPITGWDMNQSDVEAFYRVRTLFNQTFSLKDYFWPIRDHNLIVNKNLVQNPGW